jgi:hypothetical protein
MKKSRFSGEKVIAILKEADAGVKAAELRRKYHSLAHLSTTLCTSEKQPSPIAYKESFVTR